LHRPPSDQIERFSNESNVTGDTPPTFLIHSQDDRSVPVENSLLYYQALREHKVPSAMHLYPDGGHGFGMGDGRGSVEGWTRVLHDWLIDWNAGVWADIKL
jgi:dipeptidyl aminopeptidase/acylaminoacyl peptidase